MGVELRFGPIVEFDEKIPRVRIKYEDRDEALSPWLFLPERWPSGNEGYDPPDIGVPVGAIVDTENETGMVIGGVYSEADAPPVTNPDKWARHFKDGTTIEYDRAAHKLTIAGGDVKIDADLEVTGKITAGGDVQSSGNITTALGDVQAGATSLKTHVHSNGNMGSPTGPPML